MKFRANNTFIINVTSLTEDREARTVEIGNNAVHGHRRKDRTRSYDDSAWPDETLEISQQR